MEEETRNGVPAYWEIAENAGKKSAEALAETVTNQAVKALIDFVKKKSDEKTILSGTAFMRYLDNAEMYYNQAKSMATGRNPRNIRGWNDIYVETFVSPRNDGEEQKNRREASKVANIVNPAHMNVLIEGTAGSGKSVLLRRLFLETANSGEYIPVLLELRKFNTLTFEKPVQSDEDCIFDMIHQCMREFDLDLTAEQFQLSLRAGKYLFMFDGLDEVKHSIIERVQLSILNFGKKYPANPCVITTRPCSAIKDVLLQKFEVLYVCPLTERTADELTSKFQRENDKTKEFKRDLNDFFSGGNYYKVFWGNPLLLSISFLIFMQYGNSKDYWMLYFDKVYEVLYSEHDEKDKVSFRRKFRCSGLNRDGFKLLFSRLCFQMNFHGGTFSKEDLLRILKSDIKKLKLNSITAEDYLADLCEAVCVVVKTGETYKIIHCDLMAYFAAYFTDRALDDEQQIKLYRLILQYELKHNYFGFVYQMEPDRFSTNALEDGLRNLERKAVSSENPDVFILKKIKDFSYLRGNSISCREANNPTHPYEANLFHLFESLIDTKKVNLEDRTGGLKNYVMQIARNAYDKMEVPSNILEFSTVDNSKRLTDDEKREFYTALCQLESIPQRRAAVNRWLASLDAKRKAQNNVSGIESFLDSI